MRIQHNPNMLSPDVCKIKANSLPSILDEQELDTEKDIVSDNEHVKTPTSTASSGRYSIKIRGWKIPVFLRKSESGKPQSEVSSEAQSSPVCEELTITGSGYQQVNIKLSIRVNSIISGKMHRLTSHINRRACLRYL